MVGSIKRRPPRMVFTSSPPFKRLMAQIWMPTELGTTNFGTKSVLGHGWTEPRVGNHGGQNDNHRFSHDALGGSATSEHSIAEVGEMLIFGGLLSDADRQKVEGYLQLEVEITWIPIILTRTTTVPRGCFRSSSKTSWQVRSVLLLLHGCDHRIGPDLVRTRQRPQLARQNSTSGQISGTPPAFGFTA